MGCRHSSVHPAPPAVTEEEEEEDETGEESTDHPELHVTATPRPLAATQPTRHSEVARPSTDMLYTHRTNKTPALYSDRSPLATASPTVSSSTMPSLPFAKQMFMKQPHLTPPITPRPHTPFTPSQQITHQQCRLESDSQIEFFKMLDKKISEGAEYNGGGGGGGGGGGRGKVP